MFAINNLTQQHTAALRVRRGAPSILGFQPWS
jgi:hypothetical protein